MSNHRILEKDEIFERALEREVTIDPNVLANAVREVKFYDKPFKG